VKGIVSFLLVIAFLYAAVQLWSIENAAASDAALCRRDALALQKKNALELGVKLALRQAMRSATGSERETLARDAAAKIAALEAPLEEYCAARGAACDAWLGAASESEIARAIEKTRSERKPAKCTACFDLSAPALDSKNKPVALARALLDADAAAKTITVSRNGAASMPLASAALAKPGAACFGATIYFPENNAASVVMLSEGFEVETN
jgi:hypothetical protein